MYKRHKRLAWTLIITVFGLSMLLRLHYSSIAEISITVMSIALAVYISVSTSLLGSPYSRTLKKMPDKENSDKSMLGVLAEYLKTAAICSILTISLSTLYILKPDMLSFGNVLDVRVYYLFTKTLSAVACAIFALNVFLMSLIMSFLITALQNAAMPSEDDS